MIFSLYYILLYIQNGLIFKNIYTIVYTICDQKNDPHFVYTKWDLFPYFPYMMLT